MTQPDKRPWLVRVRERRKACQDHWIQCTACQMLTAELAEVMDRNEVPGERPRRYCPEGEYLRTMWMTEPK